MLTNSEALASFGFVDVTENPFVCSFLGLWDYAYDCAPKAEAALTKWIEGRRAAGKVVVRVDPLILETYVGEYQFETLNNRIYTMVRKK